MQTTWRVTKVTETEASTIAELERVAWFKTNPEYEAHADDAPPPDDMPEQFIDAEPGEEGAEFIDAEGRMNVDLSNEGDLVLHAGDDVIIEMSIVVYVDVGGGVVTGTQP